MAVAIQDGWTNLIQRIRRAYSSVITWLNSIGLMLMLYIAANPNGYEEALSFLPDGTVRDIAKFVLPFLWFVVIQKGKELDKARVTAQTRLDQ